MDRSRRTDGPGHQWDVAPRRIEDEYNVTDAVVVGNLLISLLRHSDRVPRTAGQRDRPDHDRACWTGMASAHLPPVRHHSRLAAGQVLRVGTNSPLLDIARFGEVPSVDAVATYDEETGKLAVVLVNRSVDGPSEATMDTSRTPVTGVLEALGMHDADRLAVNTADRPGLVAPHHNDSVLVEDGRITITLPPISWTALSLSTR